MGRFYCKDLRDDSNPDDSNNVRRKQTLGSIVFPGIFSAPSRQATLSIDLDSAKSDRSSDDNDKNGKSNDYDNDKVEDKEEDKRDDKGEDDADDTELFSAPSRQATLSFGIDGAINDRSSDDKDNDNHSKGKDNDSDNDNDNKGQDDDMSQIVHAPKICSPPLPRPPKPLVVMNNDTRNESAWNRCHARKPMSHRGDQNKNNPKTVGNTTSTFPIARPDFPVTNSGPFGSCGAIFAWGAE